MNRTRLVLLPVLNRYRITTAGNAWGQPNTLYIDLDVPDFARYLPMCQELTLFTGGEMMTSYLRWGIFFASAFNRRLQSGDPIQIGSTVGGSTDASLRHAAYTTVGNFNLDSRLMLGIGNSQGTANETGIASAALGMLLVGQ